MCVCEGVSECGRGILLSWYVWARGNFRICPLHTPSLLHHFLGQVLFSRVRAKTCVIPPDMSRARRPKTVQNLQWKNCRQGPFSKKNRWRRHRCHVLKEPPPVGLPSSSMARPISFPSFPAHHNAARRFGQILTERWLCLCNFWTVFLVWWLQSCPESCHFSG